jgi:malonate transporter
VELLAALFIVAPIFALICLGYGAARFKMVSAEAGNGLSEFVFVLAIPALLFRTVSSANLPEINPFPHWISYFATLAVCWIIAYQVARRMGRDTRESAVVGFSAGQSNTVLIGIPAVLGTLGEIGTVPAVLIIAIHMPITMTIVALVIARGEATGRDGLIRMLRTVISNPIMIAILVGACWRLIGIQTPEMVARFLKLLGDAAAPCALVALGMAMTKVSFIGSRRLIGVVSLLKLIVHPLLVYGLAVHVFKLPPVYSAVLIIFASCPTGINAFLVAERYRSGQAIASGSIAFSTVAAVVTMTIAVSVAMSLVR